MGFIGITPGPDTGSSKAGDMNHGDKTSTSSTMNGSSSSSSLMLTPSLTGNSSKILSVTPTATGLPAGPVQHLRVGKEGEDIMICDAAGPAGMTSVRSSSNASPAQATSTAGVVNLDPQKNHQQLLASSVAHFLLTRKGLSKEMIGRYLGNLQNSFNQLVLDHFLQTIELSGLCIDEALRKVNI